MGNAIGNFTRSVDRAYASGHKIDRGERKMLLDEFKQLTRDEQGQALEHLLVNNHAATYLKLAPHTDITLSFESFESGVAQAWGVHQELSREQRSALTEAFTRLSRNDQGQALEYLMRNNYVDLYREVAPHSTFATSLTAFTDGLNTAWNIDQRIDGGERAMLRDGLTRMRRLDQGGGLEALLQRRFSATYHAIAKHVPDAPITLKGFERGLEAVSIPGQPMTSTERSNLVDAFKRMSAPDRRAGLELPATKNFPALYDACYREL